MKILADARHLSALRVADVRVHGHDRPRDAGTEEGADADWSNSPQRAPLLPLGPRNPPVPVLPRATPQQP